MEIEMITKIVELKVSKNELYGDYRVDEFINGEWNNQADGGWSEKQAKKVKSRIELSIKNLNGSLVIPSFCDSVLN
jgi:hypothetical protein